MKEWLWRLILLSLLGTLAKHFLPKGERSPLYGPLRFLLSLCLVLAVFTPWKTLWDGNLCLDDPISKLITEENRVNGDQLILEQMGQTMARSVQTAFPESKFTLEIQTDENRVPVLIRVHCQQAERGGRIAEFIQKNYGLEAITE